jgi:S1-C subfamily serine protease
VPISPELVQQLKLCTVAIALDLGPKLHPKILGTGFSISEHGHVLTNAHVVMALMTPLEYWHTLQLSPRSCVIAYQFVPGKGMAEIKAPIKSVMAVTGKNVVPGGVIYGGPPDLSVIATGFQKTPFLRLTEKELPPEGTEVYFCGFPLGEQMFYTEHGREQVTSTLQRGIIGAHLPFSGIPNPHAFVMDATCNPGNSGSAVINPAHGDVIGVVFAKRTEAFTYAVASRGFEQLVVKIMELEKAGFEGGTGHLQMGREYAPPEDLQSEIVKGIMEEGKKRRTDEPK